MRKLTTILCSIAFAISGICLAEATATKSVSSQTVSAATMPNISLDNIKPPVDLLLGLQKETDDSIRSPGRVDTVYIKEKPEVKTTKAVKARAPKQVKKKKRHSSPLYIATRMDNKEDSIKTDSLFIYKLEKIGKIDLEKLNSSIDVNQHLSFGLCSFALHDLKPIGKYLQQVPLAYVRK